VQFFGGYYFDYFNQYEFKNWLIQKLDHPYIIFQTHFMCIILTWENTFVTLDSVSHLSEKEKERKEDDISKTKKNWENTIKAKKNISHGPK
jgi:hypothetical protein